MQGTKIDGKCSAVHYGCEEGEPVDKKITQKQINMNGFVKGKWRKR